MFKLFGILILSFLFTGIAAVPFINLLYNIKFRQRKSRSKDFLGRDTLFHQVHGHKKVGKPTGGGVLIIFSALVFSLIFYFFTDYAINWTTIILFLTMVLFGVLGLYDDFYKMLKKQGREIVALSARVKLVLQIGIALLISYLMYTKTNLHTIEIPVLDQFADWAILDLGIYFIPFATFVIIASSNAFNITDGLDGLSTGLLLIALSAFWALSGASPFAGDVTLFIAVIMGSLLAFLYFNIFPARMIMGDVGSLALGAMLAVIAFLSNQILVLPIIGGVFLIEGASSLMQILSFKFRNGKRIFKIAPLHHHFEAIGWDETKVTMRFWLAGAVLAFIGMFIATFTL